MKSRSFDETGSGQAAVSRHGRQMAKCQLLLAGILIALFCSSSAAAQAVKLVEGLAGGSGSTIGPDGALFVTENIAGRVSRVNPQTGAVTPFATGLPTPIIPGAGGAVDITFYGGTAYVLVTLVGMDLGGTDTVGIYRVDGPTSFTVVADIGTWAWNNPPAPGFEYFVPTGVQYAIENYRGGFLVTDGHHNRVLRVDRNGDISEFIAFDNIVPTGLAISGRTVYMAEAGPTPHLPADGRIVSFEPESLNPEVEASGGPLLVDVEFGRGRTMYGLAQGEWDGMGAGSPAIEDDGSLLQTDGSGGFTVVYHGLDRPTSMQFIGNTAYVITLDGEIWTIDDVSDAPFGTTP